MGHEWQKSKQNRMMPYDSVPTNVPRKHWPYKDNILFLILFCELNVPRKRWPYLEREEQMRTAYKMLSLSQRFGPGFGLFATVFLLFIGMKCPPGNCDHMKSKYRKQCLYKEHEGQHEGQMVDRVLRDLRDDGSTEIWQSGHGTLQSCPRAGPNVPRKQWIYKENIRRAK